MTESKTEKIPQNITNTHYIYILIAATILVTSPFFPTPDHMGSTGWSALAIVFFGVILWFTNVIPPPVTSMIIITLFPLFGILTFPESASSLGAEVIWLIIAMLIFGVAVEKTGLSDRLVYTMFSRVGDNMKLIVLALIFVAFALTFFIPNAIGRVTVLLPISHGIIQAIGKKGGKNVGKSIMLVVTYTPIICTVALMTGATGSVYAASLFKTMLGYEWNYLHWMIVMVPVTLTILTVLWLITILKFPVDNTRLNGGKQYFSKMKDEIGPMSQREKKLLVLYGLLITLWVTQGIHQMSIAMSAVLIVIFLFIPKMEVIDWRTAVKGVDWGVPLLFAAGLTLASAFQESGVVHFSTTIAVNYLSNFSSFTLAVTLMLVFAIIRLGFTNLSTTIASLMPVIMTFALSTPFNPIWIAMISLVASSMGFLLPTQSIGTMITYSLGYFTAKDLFETGVFLTISTIVITLIFAYFYWPFIGITVY